MTEPTELARTLFDLAIGAYCELSVDKEKTVIAMIDNAMAAARAEGWQAANHAWQDWLEANIPGWDAMAGVDLTTLPKGAEMTEPTDRHREIATKIAVRAVIERDREMATAFCGRHKCIQYAFDDLSQMFAAARAEERAEFAQLIREKLAEPDVSATAAEHLIGVKSGWRTAIRRILDELSE